MLPTAAEADIALLLEGTYPYVRGGVSSWVHALIQGFPRYRFAVVFLGSKPGDYQGVQYRLPENLVHVEAHYLQNRVQRGRIRARMGSAAPGVFGDVRAMHEAFRQPGGGSGGAFAATVGHLMHGRLEEKHFLESRDAWDMLTGLYRSRCTDPSFVDYFWTVRSMHEPIWILARIARSALPVRCYHSVSTGYAGLLGSMLARGGERPFILSEHGLYTKERKIDLFHSPWIRDASGSAEGGAMRGSYIRNLWIRFFESLGRAAYASADPIVSLYEGIRRQQIGDGARPERTLCIPNGIPIGRYAPLRDLREHPPKPVFTLIGRVVPIKDVKTFVRAMRTVCNRIPEAQGLVAGPTGEDPRYFQECRALAESLGLADSVRFLGYRNVSDILPQTALLVLSSISEALPLALLEGFAAGVPAVATDVGSCRQLIEGRDGDAEDSALGAAGRVVDIGDPAALAEAVIGLYSDREEWSRASRAGVARAERFYSEERMLASYGEIYRKALGRG
jgi:polysaccharide biosynthesis protein PelF